MPALGYATAYPFKRITGGFVPPIALADNIKVYILLYNGQISVSPATAVGLQMSLEI